VAGDDRRRMRNDVEGRTFFVKRGIGAETAALLQYCDGV
jgi:hypothetical protein